jgi:Mg2+ and Co2+ transporter CorA
MPQPVRSFHIVGDQFAELESLAETLPATGYLWLATTRAGFEAALPDLQARLQAWTGAQLFELHVLDLLNQQLPSSYDYTSAYDLLVFRRLATGAIAAIDDDGPPSAGRQNAIEMIDTSAVGFVVFDRLLLTVHPTDCQVREFFAARLQNQTSSTAEGRASARMPAGPADLMLRMVNYMVDSYLALRRLLTKQLDELQEQLFDLHVLDLLNAQLPSTFDYTSAYDLLVFRRLAAGAIAAVDADGPPASGRQNAIAMIDTSPVGFAVFDRVLLTVHPTDCQVREFFAQRLQNQTAGVEGRASARMPTNPADLMLRMVNYMVDSYLELRRLLTKQLDELQEQLFSQRGPPNGWRLLLDSRNALHLLEDTCEDQRASIIEWIDALEEWPLEEADAPRREREQLRVRSRDVLEHIERVLAHVRRLEASSETAVQMHFSEQSNRTNLIMRTLTTLTAIFLPLNLVTGFFGMNFEGLPLIHSPTGFWIIFLLMLALGVGMSIYFWRKRYLGRH